MCGGCGQSCFGALPDEIAFELPERAEDVKDEASAWRCGVDGFGQRGQSDATGIEPGDDLDQMLQGAPKSVQPPVWWSSNSGHNDRFFCCHFPFVDGGRQIAQYRVQALAVVKPDEVRRCHFQKTPAPV